MTERGARRRRECQSARRDGSACVRARGAGASGRAQAPVQVSVCKRQSRASARAWQVRGCRSASARKEQAPERGKCEVSECQRQIKASARARGATAAQVTERGARRRRECRSARRDGGASVRARGATAARVTERGARRRRECQSAGRDGSACVRARGAGASGRAQAPVQVSECKRQNRASARAWQVRGCQSASARIKQAPEHGKCAGGGVQAPE